MSVRRNLPADATGSETRRVARPAPHTAHFSLGRRLAAVLLLLTFAAVMAGGCGGGPSAGEPGDTTELSVFAAAGLTQAFTELGEQFSASHPDVKVVFNFAGAPTLVSQIEQGATPDIFAIADTDNMEKVADLMGESRVFARNRMTIVVEPGNPRGVASLADLADQNLKVVLGSPELPAGKCANKILTEQGIVVKPVSLEESVKGIVTKVSLGEADAGMAWVSEIATAKGKVEGIDIPDRQNVIEVFPIAIAKGCEHADAAQAFVDFVFSDAGQQVLGSYDFMPPR